MQIGSMASAARRLALASAVAAVSLGAAACSDDNGDSRARRRPGCTTRCSGWGIRW